MLRVFRTSLLFSAFVIHVCHQKLWAEATRASVLARTAAYALDRATSDWAHSSRLCASYTGKLANVPLDDPLVELKPNVTGTTQQAIWALFTKYELCFDFYD